MKILRGEIIVKDLTNFFSKTYALDLFVNNADRHFGNYLFRQSAADTYIPLAFDFGLSWCESGYKGLNALDEEKNTESTIQTIKRFNLFDSAITINTLNLIKNMDGTHAIDLINNIPEEWMSKIQKNTISDWWQSREFNNRLDEIYSHVLV
jgi:hypothetical protein